MFEMLLEILSVPVKISRSPGKIWSPSEIIHATVSAEGENLMTIIIGKRSARGLIKVSSRKATVFLRGNPKTQNPETRIRNGELESRIQNPE